MVNRIVHKIEIHFSNQIYINTDKILTAILLPKLEINNEL